MWGTLLSWVIEVDFIICNVVSYLGICHSVITINAGERKL